MADPLLELCKAADAAWAHYNHLGMTNAYGRTADELAAMGIDRDRAWAEVERLERAYRDALAAADKAMGRLAAITGGAP